MYADDTVIFYSAKHIEELKLILNDDLHHINNWVTKNGLRLNPTKTQFMILGTR